MKPVISHIVARSENGVIGVDGDLPWRLPSDLAHFKRVTMGLPCVMGRVTWESLPFPLPGRANLVLTRNTDYRAEGAEVFHTLYDIMSRAHAAAGASGATEIAIIGGAKVYAHTLPHTDRIYLTDVHTRIDGHAHYDVPQGWTTVSRTEAQQGSRDDHAFSIRVLERPA